jgi:hypothetical protein
MKYWNKEKALTFLDEIIIHSFIHSFIHIPVAPLKHRTSAKRFVSLRFPNLRELIGLLGRGINPSKGRYLHKTTQTQNKRRQISMPRVGFEPTTQVIEQTKTVYVIGLAATVIGG